MIYLVDTCVISELVTRKPSPAVVSWMERVDDQLLYLSAITIGEVVRGIAKLPDSRRRLRLENWLADELLVRFRSRILSTDLPVMLSWGRMVADLELKGRPLPAIDSLIAALALHHDLQLVTRNEKGFEDTGVPITNPWN